MPDDRFRIAPGLLLIVARDGTPIAWHPRLRKQIPLDPDILSLLLRFGDGSTVADAAAAAAIEADDSLAGVVAMLVEQALLISTITSPPNPLPLEIARRRIDEIVDPGSFHQTTGRPITTGFATVDARKIAIASWEPGADHGIEEVLALQEAVLASPCPIVYVLDRFALGYRAADFHGPRSVGRIYANQARLSGRTPQIAIVCGSLQRPAALLPVGCDLVVFLEAHGFVHIGDREIVKQMTGEDASPDELGGARMHLEVSGLGHLVARSTPEAATLVRRYLGLMPATESDLPPTWDGGRPPTIAPRVLDELVPEDADTPFAMSELVRAVLDDGSRLELRPGWARELSTTLGRIDGIPVGIVANCSQHRAGMLSVEAADKAARFIALCSTYGLPLVFFVDVLGFAIGRVAERAGIERAAGRLFGALAAARVPKLTVAVRKAHTAGLFAMAGLAFDPDSFLALPTASISILNERFTVGGVSSLERIVDDATRASLRSYLRSNRSPPQLEADEVIPASRLRDALASRLHARSPEPRVRQPIPP